LRYSLVILMFLVSVSSAVEPPEDHVFLTSTNWSASVLSHHAGGSVCWVMGDDGSVRVEVLLDPEGSGDDGDQTGSGTEVNLDHLMTWTGDGWTLVLGPDGNGTLNGWGKEWDQVPADLSQVVRLVTGSMRKFPNGPVDFPFAKSIRPTRGNAGIPRPGMLGSGATGEAGEDVWRYQVTPSDAPGFRKRMTARGRGAGGVGEVLILRWRRPEGQEGQDGYGLSVGSSRRPGTLHLDPPRNLTVKTPDPEVFLPLWPLSQFFDAR